MSRVKLGVLAQSLCGAMLVWVLLFVNFSQSDGVRFTHDRLNALVEDAACIIPGLVLTAILLVPFSRRKWWLVAGLAPVALFALFYGRLNSGFRTTPTLLQTLPVENTRVRLYREQPFLQIDARDLRHLIIQQETPLLPHIVWVRQIMTNDADTAKLTLTGRHRVRCVFANQTDVPELQPNPRRMTFEVR